MSENIASYFRQTGLVSAISADVRRCRALRKADPDLEIVFNPYADPSCALQ